MRLLLQKCVEQSGSGLSVPHLHNPHVLRRKYKLIFLRFALPRPRASLLQVDESPGVGVKIRQAIFERLVLAKWEFNWVSGVYFDSDPVSFNYRSSSHSEYFGKLQSVSKLYQGAFRLTQIWFLGLTLGSSSNVPRRRI